MQVGCIPRKSGRHRSCTVAMAFHQPTPAPRELYASPTNQEESTLTYASRPNDRLEESQEWILFSPSQAASTTTETQTDRTPCSAGISHISDFGSLATRSGQLTQSNVEDAFTDDGELDSLDEGLHAFREPSIYRSPSYQGHRAVLPAHDGLGTFPASSAPFQDQLWQHEQYNPKRKHDGNHHRRSSVPKRLDTIEDLDLQMTEEKRIRIEQWRLDQSQALLKEVAKETRRGNHQSSIARRRSSSPLRGAGNEVLPTAPELHDASATEVQETDEVEPFWRRVTRRFIRDVIGIDEPLLSIIVGETLPEDMHAIADLVNNPEGDPTSHQLSLTGETWPDRLLHRIARELGLLVNKLSPRPGAFTAVSPISPDYAGIPISEQSSEVWDSSQCPNAVSRLNAPPFFLPTVQNPAYNASVGVEDEVVHEIDGAAAEMDDSERLRREREYWERELDIKMVFRFLKSRFSPGTSSRRQDASYRPIPTREDSTRRADVIRRHHPLVAKHQQPSIARLQRNSNPRYSKWAASSCASESARSGRRPSLAKRSGSSRNYWDIGGSVGSGSAIASGATMGAWGEA